MTYQEILKAKHFLNEIEELTAKVDSGETPFQEAKTLDAEIKSSFPEYQATGFNWNTISFSANDQSRYRTSICNALKVMHTALEAVLIKQPYYGKMEQANADLSRLSENTHFESGQKRKLIVELVAKYSAEIKFGKPVIDYVDHGDALFEEDKTEEIYNALVGALKLYLEELPSEKTRTVRTEKPILQIYNQQTNTQTVSMNLQISIENCLKDLDDCESLSSEEISEIKQQLDDIQKLMEDKRGKKKHIKEKISSILKWVADKGTDAMIALLPTVFMMLSGL